MQKNDCWRICALCQNVGEIDPKCGDLRFEMSQMKIQMEGRMGQGTAKRLKQDISQKYAGFYSNLTLPFALFQSNIGQVAMGQVQYWGCMTFTRIFYFACSKFLMPGVGKT